MSDIAPRPAPWALPPAASFLLGLTGWTIAGLALVRVPSVEQGLVQFLVDVQRELALWYGATATTAVVVNASCSGADQMALSLGATLAYPVRWSRRLAGAAAGLLLVVIFNTLRIGTLMSTADSPRVFRALHEYVWPVLLMAVVVAFIVQWIRWSESRRMAAQTSATLARFGAASAILLVAYGLVAPWTFTSTAVAAAGAWIAQAGGALLAFAGPTSVQGNVLVTTRGAFAVTPACLLTPLIPLYLAAAVTWPAHWPRRTAAIALALPVFLLLAVVRLLVLALPPALIEAPTIVVHGFFQFVLGVVIVGVAARFFARPPAVAFGGALGMALLLGMWWNGVLIAAAGVLQSAAPHARATLSSPADVQGALALLPVYQLALLTGTWLAVLGRRHFLAFTVATAGLFALQALTLVVVGEFEAHAEAAIHALVVRAWAVAAPLALTAVAARSLARTSRAPTAHAYRAFWNEVGDQFPTLTGAASTDYYRRSEIRLLAEHLPHLAGATIFKSDLWDEVKNTRIMQWAAAQGARVYGIDISAPIVEAARRGFGHLTLRASRADVRALPFACDSFDAVYSMGTVEHFPETETAVRELARVVKPGGRLILGVPNLHDPFLRPLFAWVLQRIGCYGYGDEKAYSRAQLRRMIEAAGLQVEVETGILFIPGWLRMADLWAHTRYRPLTRLTAPMVAFFETLESRFPRLRRHGYLLATVATKPTPSRMISAGVEYVVDAHGCDPSALRSPARLQVMTSRLVADLQLRVVGTPTWHAFPGQAGVTGLVMLAESHVSVHTFPERGFAAVNLYCCRPVADWPWGAHLAELLGATDVRVRIVSRGDGLDAANAHAGGLTA